MAQLPPVYVVSARRTPIGHEVADPFLVDRIRPAHGEKPLDAELDRQIPQMEGIQKVGVQQNDPQGAVRDHAP